MKTPDKIRKHRPKGCEIKFIGNNYYVYKVHSVYDKKKKRAQKISDEIIGKITAKDGLLPSDKNELKLAVKSSPMNKEYGGYLLSKFLIEKDLKIIKKIFSSDWKKIFFLSYIRFIYRSKLIMSEYYYNSSYFSISGGSNLLGEKQLTDLIKRLGAEKEKILCYQNEIQKIGESIPAEIKTIFKDINNPDLSRHGNYFKEGDNVIDTLKNTLGKDENYIRNEKSLEGLMFIDLLVLRMHSKLVDILKEKELLQKYSPDDIINIMRHIQKIKIKDNWLTNEISKKHKEIIQLIGLNIS
jgi:hypothetical protein